MGWPYAFLDLSAEEREARRVLLDRYGVYSELLAVLPVVVMLGVRMVVWTAARTRGLLGGGGEYGEVPTSPMLKSRRQAGGIGAWRRRQQRQLSWWLSSDVVLWGTTTLGQRDQWLAGAAWTVLLAVLCVRQTGGDYLHLTKRCGIVGVAQLPLQYVLGLKWANPVAAVLDVSHEQLNRWHRVLGVVVYGLLATHSGLYLNFFFVQAAAANDDNDDDGAKSSFLSALWPRLARPVVVVGLLALVAMTLLSTTALAVVRRWSYRVFFVSHVIAAIVVPPLLLVHTRHAAPYAVAALLLLVVDMATRRLHTVAVTTATVVAIPGTDLVRVDVPLPPAAKLSPFGRHPGCHVYVSLPPAARRAEAGTTRAAAWLHVLLFEFLFNPFTVAAVDELNHSLSLVVRTRRGPMTSLLASRASRGGAIGTGAVKPREEDEEEEDDDEDVGEDAPAIPVVTTTHGPLTPLTPDSPPPPSGLPLHINIEGPYGSAAHFPDLSAHSFDHVLLVAGGIGATFVVPFYRALLLLDDDDTTTTTSPKVDLVWAVRSAGDATWAVVAAAGQDDGGSRNNILADPNVHIFLTGRRDDNNDHVSGHSGHPDSIELTTTTTSSRRRPDFGPIVDDVFRSGVETRVAVIVCGPEAMVRDLRAAVSPWVQRGRSVWWHNESFGW